jgi:ATP-dependent Clp protease adaptor protein ClpS|tara:strand:+ start:55 stop:360 length:306 start_codon:yes stop_codon:yes gene_type:complete
MSVETEIVLDEKVDIEVREPKQYKVVFLNDNSTPMEFVIDILVKIFKHTDETARDLTMQIHNEGSGVVGIYSYEIAEQKAVETTTLARNHGFALQIKVEEE